MCMYMFTRENDEAERLVYIVGNQRAWLLSFVLDIICDVLAIR